MKIVNPNRIRHSYTQSLVASPEKVFPLLCPVREADWIPDWDPDLVVSATGVAETDCVFVTPGTPRASIWIITSYDPDGYTLIMYKVTANHSVGRLDIALSGIENGGTAAEVAYTYTSLSQEGDAFLQSFTEASYRTFMEQWERELNHYLTTGEQIKE